MCARRSSFTQGGRIGIFHRQPGDGAAFALDFGGLLAARIVAGSGLSALISNWTGGSFFRDGLPVRLTTDYTRRWETWFSSIAAAFLGTRRPAKTGVMGSRDFVSFGLACPVRA